MADAEKPEIKLGAITEAERLRIMMGRERSPFYEMLSEGEPREVLHATRMICAGFESKTVLRYQTPDSKLYAASLKQNEVEERLQAVTRSYKRNYGGGWPDKLKEKGYDTDPSKALELARALANASNELEARLSVTQKLIEQIAFSGDIQPYLVDAFTRPGKRLVASKLYKFILTTKETEVGYIEFGKKVDRAFRAFVNIGEGKAEILLDNGKRKNLPNIWALPAHIDLINLALAGYVLPELSKMRSVPGNVSVKKEDLDTPDLLDDETYDDWSAAVTALVLFRHWDYDVRYAFGRKGSGEAFDVRNLTQEDWKGMSLEIDASSKDSAKLNIEARRAGEWGIYEEGGRRDHPRVAGNPMSIGCYPILTAPALEIIKTEMAFTAEMAVQVSNAMEREGIGNYEMPTKIEVSVNDSVFQNNTLVPVEVQNANGKKRKIQVRVNYTPLTLGEVDWDGAKIINAGTDEAFLRFVLGPQTDAFEVPYKLQGFYAYKDVFAQVMRVDHMQLYEEIVKGSMLAQMNKGVTLALVLLASGYNLSEDTVKKLDNYVRCVFLATLAAAVTDDLSVPIEKGPQVNQFGAYRRENAAQTALLEAARISAFLPLNKEGSDIDSNWKNIFIKIQKRRKAFLPAELEIFTDKDLESLKPLYPFGGANRSSRT